MSDVWYARALGKQVAMPAWVEFLLSGICHRFPGHALTYGGQLSPLCARCTGMYCGALLFIVLLWAGGAGRRAGYAPGYVQGMVLALAVWWALDGANAFAFELLGRPWLYEPTGAIRLLTGLGVGMGIAIELWPAAAQTMLDAPDPRPAIQRPVQSAGLLGVVISTGLLLLSDRLPWVLVALWSTAGVATLLVGANTLLLALVKHTTGSRLRGTRLVYLICGGTALALAETGGLALLRRLVGA
ncbi:MAG: DUF2085 domain-containing protein [Anaerolineae bacterium]